MKIEYQLRGLKQGAADDRPMDHHLEYLGSLIPVDTAKVVLEHQWNASPAYSASVDMAVPGPDIHAAARDHTLDAAVRKVARRLGDQIEARAASRQLRLKGREQGRRVSSSVAR